ncbi:MAG: hypothetical protein JWQ04_3132 [Pedosphaera sp.]|nr:hypothetical protein [Pedosphaera sp.]
MAWGVLITDMNKTSLLKTVLLIGGTTVLASGCVVREEVRYRSPQPPPVVVEAPAPPGGEVVVTEAPPAPIVETLTVAPAPGFIWIGGGWIWRGGWVWAPGHWDRPPRRGAVWIAPRYAYRGGRHVWVRGYWR